VTRVSTSALRLHTGLKGIKVRGAMDDERIDSLLTTVMDLGKQVLAMECHLAELEAAVCALKAFVAAHVSG
jgi:hypothetical protein